MTLTTSSRWICCQGEHRCLTAFELLAAQGLPACEFDLLSETPFVGPLAELSEAALVRMAVNAMSAPCIGPILWWVSQHAFPIILFVLLLTRLDVILTRQLD